MEEWIKKRGLLVLFICVIALVPLNCWTMAKMVRIERQLRTVSYAIDSLENEIDSMEVRLEELGK